MAKATAIMEPPKAKVFPFDLKKALSGAVLVTRNGQPATGFRHRRTNNGTDENYPYEAIVAGKSRCFTPNGTYWVVTADPLDLFLAGEEGQESGMTTKELNSLAHKIAESTAKLNIECHTLWVKQSGQHFGRWYDLKTADGEDKEHVDQAVTYLEARKLLMRNPEDKMLVRWNS